MRPARTIATLCTVLALACGESAPQENTLARKDTAKQDVALGSRQVGFSYLDLVWEDGEILRGSRDAYLRHLKEHPEESRGFKAYFAEIAPISYPCERPCLYGDITSGRGSELEIGTQLFDFDFDLVPERVDHYEQVPDGRDIHVSVVKRNDGTLAPNLRLIDIAIPDPEPDIDGHLRIHYELDEERQKFLEERAVAEYTHRSQEFREWAEESGLLDKIRAYEGEPK